MEILHCQIKTILICSQWLRPIQLTQIFSHSALTDDVEKLCDKSKKNYPDGNQLNTELGNTLLSDTKSLKSHLSNYQIYVEPDVDFLVH